MNLPASTGGRSILELESTSMPQSCTSTNTSLNRIPVTTGFDPHEDDIDLEASGGADSGYGSIVSIPNKPSNRIAGDAITYPDIRITKSRLFMQKTTKLKPYPTIQIPQFAWDRYNDLKELFNIPLCAAISKGKGPVGPFSIRLKVLGENEQSAKPWILVFCDGIVAKRVRDFFKQSWVKEELCGPKGEDHPEPGLEVVVCQRPPTPLVALTAGTSIFLPLQAGSFPITWPVEPTIYGQAFMIREQSDIKLATIGGPIKVAMSDSESSLYVLSCGHIISHGPQKENDLDSLADQMVDEGPGVSPEEGSDSFILEDEVFELELNDASNLNDVASMLHPPALNEKLSRGEIFGHTVASSFDVPCRNTFLDWMLINMASVDYESKSVPLILHKRKGLKPWHGIHYQGAARSVLLFSGMSGIVWGTLSLNTSYFMLPQGSGFAEVFEFTARGDSGKFLEYGDSGSWVIDQNTFEVYGHVVAADALGDAYIVPINATLEDIKTTLQAQSVTIASGADVVLHWRHHMKRKPSRPTSEALASYGIHPPSELESKHTWIGKEFQGGSDGSLLVGESKAKTKLNIIPGLERYF